MSNCLVTGGTKNDTAPIAVLLMNLKATQSWVDHVVVFHDGISEKQQRLMQDIMPVEFVCYRFPGNKKNFNEIVKYYYSEMVFCKYECFKLLMRFDNIVWSDYDVLFLKDVQELLTGNITGFSSLMYDVNHSVGTLRRQLRTGMDKIVGKNYDLDTASIATGLFVMNRSLGNCDEIYQSCIDLTEQYGECLCLPEQAIFDMIAQMYQIAIQPISWKYAVHPEKDAERLHDAKILHAYSQPKFWNGLHNDTWQRYYEQWLAMGGTPWEIGLAGLIRQMKRSIAYRWRKLLFGRKS